MISSSVEFKEMTFPCGEPHITISNPIPFLAANVNFEFENSGEILKLLLLVDAIKRHNMFPRTLRMPYVPFSRQDRIANSGECFSLAMFCNLINALEFERVLIDDPHSDVTSALIKNVVIRQQFEIFKGYFLGSEYWLISPDGGALKKIYKLAAETNSRGVVECSKIRDTRTGKITGTTIHAKNLDGMDCYIVDDICDGGATFVEIAKGLKKLNAGQIHLMVTHGFFTKGLSVFDGLIDHIYTRNGKVK